MVIRLFRVTGAALLAAACLVSVVDAHADDAPSDVAAAAHYREALGLDDSTATITAAANQDAGRVAAMLREFGAPLLPAEEAVLRHRQEASLQGHEALVAWLNSHGRGSFGGEYIDNQADRYVVLATDDAAATAMGSAIRAAMSDPAMLDVRRVTTPLSALDDALATLTTSFDSLALAGVDIAGAAVDVAGNRLDVSLAAPSPAAQSLVANVLGPVSFFTHVTGPNLPRATKADVLDAPPVRGGQSIKSPFQGTDGNTYLGYCTTAFVGYNQTGGSFLSNIVTYYALTAGHCGKVNGAWTQASYAVGTAAQSTFTQSNPAGDSMIINAKYGDGSNQVFENYSSTQRGYAYMNSVATGGQANVDVVGASVCHAGATTTYRCGTVYATNASIVYAADPLTGQPKTTLTRMRESTNLYSDHGDSGGSIVHNDVAYGVLSGGPDSNLYITYWTHVRNAMSAVGLQSIKTTAQTQIP
ncbi:MAG TPA: S1 family peptidase [Mycobacteriales bacterium]|jgi:hypothetical protein